MKIKKFIEEMLTPQAEFTPIPFWFINDELKPEVIKTQLMDYKEKGVNGVVVHPRIGIPKSMPYLSESYFEILKFICQTAKELDMRLVLYDEGMYPSGSANGQVVAANPDFASLGLTLTDDYSQGKLIYAYPDGKCLVEKKSGGTIRGIHFGEDDGEEHAPLSADILNPKAVAKFIELVHEAHYQHLHEFFGETVIGFFTDEPDPLGRNVHDMVEWTTGMEDTIVDMGGNIADLRALFEGKTNDTTKIYKKVAISRLNEVYYKALYEWCDGKGIWLMGHPAKSDDIEEQKYFHVPGQDLIQRKVSIEEGGLHGVDSVQAKCSSDAARYLKRRRNSNECFGVCYKDNIPWYLTARDMKWFIDWLGIRGVNLFIPHAFYYSVDGIRHEERPPDVGPNNIWWPYYKQFSNYMKRMSWVMTDSKNDAKVAILCESRQMPVEEVRPLYEHQIEFNYVPKKYLNKADYKYIFDSSHKNFSRDIMKFVEDKKRCFIVQESCKDLRVSHVWKQGVEMFAVFNEGNEEIKTSVEITTDKNAIWVDLWRGEYYRAEKDEAGIHLQMQPHEAKILILTPESVESIPWQQQQTFLGNISEDLQLQSDDPSSITKAYCGDLVVGGVIGNEVIEVTGEEMAECWCNGQFIGVSFFNSHRFEIGPHLKVGENEIKVVLTGNIANRYSNEKIQYGIFNDRQ